MIGGDARLFLHPFGKFLAGHAGAREVNPSQTGPLQFHRAQVGNGIDPRIQVAPVVIKIGNQLLQLVFAMIIGRFGHDQTERVWRQPQAFHLLAKISRNFSSSMITLPTWPPAMLKVLVPAVIMISRSLMSSQTSAIT